VQHLPIAHVEHTKHIRGGGTCAYDRSGRTAPVTTPLEHSERYAGGTGSAITTIDDVTLDRLLGEDWHRFILLRAKVKHGRVSSGIPCADLPQTPPSATFENPPSSGGCHPW
jgi:hypothetical protein